MVIDGDSGRLVSVPKTVTEDTGKVATPYRHSLTDLVADVLPPEDQDLWMLTPHSAFSGDGPALARQNVKVEGDRLLLRPGRGGLEEGSFFTASQLSSQSSPPNYCCSCPSGNEKLNRIP